MTDSQAKRLYDGDYFCIVTRSTGADTYESKVTALREMGAIDDKPQLIDAMSRRTARLSTRSGSLTVSLAPKVLLETSATRGGEGATDIASLLKASRRSAAPINEVSGTRGEGELPAVSLIPNLFMVGDPHRPPIDGGPHRPPIDGGPHRPPIDGGPHRPPIDGGLAILPLGATRPAGFLVPEALAADLSSDVEVFILDTIPTEEAFEGNPNPAKSDPDHTFNRLWSMFLANQMLLHRARYIPLFLPDSRDAFLAAAQDGYDLRDHGLFAAGIVAELAPLAKIHLIEVLNRGGVGDLIGFSQAIAYVNTVADPLKRRIINMSLTFPTPEEIVAAGTAMVAGDPTLADEWAAEYTALFQLLLNLQDQVVNITQTPVAAAGNMRRTGQPIPPTRYPGYVPGVIGVGALKKRLAGQPYQPASYSNDADRPTELLRTWVFGGDYDPVLAQTDPMESAKGIIGVSTTTESGYACWTGTSFACAVISGALARMGAPDDWSTALSEISTPLMEGGVEIGKAVNITQP
jgi:hypothetical protein